MATGVAVGQDFYVPALRAYDISFPVFFAAVSVAVR
jgi:hypothetical protein